MHYPYEGVDEGRARYRPSQFPFNRANLHCLAHIPDSALNFMAYHEGVVCIAMVFRSFRLK